MIDAIYLVTPSKGYLDDIFEGFAAGARGVERIVRDHYRTYSYIELTSVRVDMDERTVVAIEEDGDERTYYIREIRRHADEQD
jgi:hypothetical protein